MELLSPLIDLYDNAGAYGDPILIATLALMLVGSVMLFFVRLVKRFVLYSIIALVLPNSIGLVGYLDQASDVREAIVERGEQLSEEAQDAIDDRELSALSFGFIGSAVAVSLGLVGMVRLTLRRRPE
jgi:hypothetical protein